MRILHLIFILSMAFELYAQQDSMLNQPTIMVIPFAKEEIDLRNFFESDSAQHVRVAMTKVKNAFDTTHLKTIDFKSMIQRIENDRILTHHSQQNFKNSIIQYAGIDIYIEVEAKIVKTSRGNSVTVILNAFDAFSGHSLANGFGHSPKFYTQNFEKLSEKALDKFLGKFVQSTQKALIDLNENGRSITLNIGIAQGISMDMDSEIGNSDLLLSDEIELWLEKNTLNTQFNIQGITATTMIINEIKIPKIDPQTQRNYRPSKFARSFIQFLASLGVEAKRDIQGTNIFITLE